MQKFLIKTEANWRLRY